MLFLNADQTRLSLREDLYKKFEELTNSKEPLNLAIDSLNKTILGAKTMNAEEVLLPLGCGTISLYTAIKNTETALHRFANCKIVSGLFHSAIASFSGFVAVYNFNNFANKAYNAGIKNI